MGDVIMFRPRASQQVDPEVEKFLQRMLGVMDREAQRRASAYGRGEVSPELLRILELYPMFKLTHAKRARRCDFCGHRIAPMELHFVHGGGHVCQSGTCMEGAK